LNSPTAIAAEVERLIEHKAACGHIRPPSHPQVSPSPEAAISTFLCSANALQQSMPGVDIMHLLQSALSRPDLQGQIFSPKLSSMRGKAVGTQGHMPNDFVSALLQSQVQMTLQSHVRNMQVCTALA
jgi:hypothetical protein